MRTIIAIMLLFCAAPVHAWSEADTRREVGYFVLHGVDWMQTLDISGNCGHTTRTVRKDHKVGAGGDLYTTETNPPAVTEMNPILGKCPDRGEVNRFFALNALLHYGISRALPAAHRKWWQRITISVKAGVVDHNASIGLTLRF